jgi:pilus assembly protein Flp/PilA
MLSFLSYVTTFLTRIAPQRKDDDRGATAVEYGLMVALIAIVIIAGVTLLGTNLLALFNAIAAELA